MTDTEDKLRIVELRSQGKSINTIAKETGKAKQTIVNICKDMREEIAACNAINLEALYEAEKIRTEERIKTLSFLLAKVKTELEGRSLIDVPTEKLLDMYIKTNTALEGAMVEPVFQSSEEQTEAKRERRIIEGLS